MRLLIIGRLDGHISVASKIAMARGAKVAQVDTIDAGLTALRAGQGAEIAMVDISLDISQLVKSLASERITLPVVACGLANDAQAAVDAIKAGAKEYIPLPPDPELIAAVLQAVSAENNELVWRDPAMHKLLTMADRVAPSDASILVTGPSGSGKEVLARYLHQKSRRAGDRFVAVNCAAIPENLLESELFGHEKGAFTGAVARRIGRFEEANNGTLLLDEISEMDPRLQAKLLRAIQEREIFRVGSNHSIKIDIRLIATSNRNLVDAVAEGTFREDLLYRINVVHLQIPELQQRPKDILPLANHFTKKYAEANGMGGLSLNAEAQDRLTQHHWRGNVRELENTVHRAVLLSVDGVIGADAIVNLDYAGTTDAARALDHAAGAADAAGPADTLVGRTVAEVERDLIIDTLGHCLGNRTHAANILGISIRTLRNKLKAYTGQGISVPMPGDTNRISA